MLVLEKKFKQTKLNLKQKKSTEQLGNKGLKIFNDTYSNVIDSNVMNDRCILHFFSL